MLVGRGLGHGFPSGFNVIYLVTLLIRVSSSENARESVSPCKTYDHVIARSVAGVSEEHQAGRFSEIPCM